jgi:serine/threonine-protein kinase RsbW
MAELSAPAQMGNLDRLIDFIISGSKAIGFSDKQLEEIHLASEEILVNIISYAYADKSEPGNVKIRYTHLHDDPGIRIEFLDSGVPYDPLGRPDPDISLPLEERQTGGLGLFLVKSVMSSVTYKRIGECNCLTIEKMKQRGS